MPYSVYIHCLAFCLTLTLFYNADNSKNMVLMNERRPEVNELSFAKDLEEYKMPLVWIDLEMTGTCFLCYTFSSQQ